MLAENTAPMPFGKQQQRNQHAKSAYYSSAGTYTPQPVLVTVASTSRQTVTTFGVDDRVTTQQPTISRMSNKNVHNSRAYDDNAYDGRRMVYTAKPELSTFFKHGIADNNASKPPAYTDAQTTVVATPHEDRSVNANASTNRHSNTIQIRDGEQAKIQMQTVRRDRHYSRGTLRGAQSESNLRHSQQVAGAQMAGKDANTGESTTTLSDGEVYQIRLMFSARDTTVVVCTCLANVYLVQRHATAKSVKKEEWQLFATGVPVLLLESSACRRRVSLIVAERGTGFTLYRDSLDQLSDYTELGRTFHTHRQSTDPSHLTGLSFDSSYAAMQFYQQVQDASKKSKQRRHSFSASKRASAMLRKTDISQPCCFNHVTSLKPEDILQMDALATTGSKAAQQQAMTQSCHQSLATSGYASAHSSQPSVQPVGAATMIRGFESKRTHKLMQSASVGTDANGDKLHSPSQSV